VIAQSFCICGAQMARGYSGGRYHAWIMSEALASSGSRVTLWTTAVPEYAADFAAYPGHAEIVCHIDPNYRRAPIGHFDWIIIVPDRSSPIAFYERWLFFAYSARARVALLNFESPNWFNALSGTPVPEAYWNGWRLVSEYCDVVLSSAAESTRYAREFYTRVPRECRFTSCPPAINSRVADSVEPGETLRQIVVIARLGGTNFVHKGGADLLEAFVPEMAGYELLFLIGISAVEDGLLRRLEARAAEFGVRLRFLNGADDRTKFREIKRSRLMLFLSRFEGFGYPPIEALYCGTPCVAYDLPVLREFSGDALTCVPVGDFAALRATLSWALLGEKPDSEALRRQVAPVAEFDSFVARLAAVFVPAGGGLPIVRFGFVARMRCRLRLLVEPVAAALSVRFWLSRFRRGAKACVDAFRRGVV
jgi:glycosyltransferase involved in cell wall biosynthesis